MMQKDINKKLISERFAKSINTYNNNAIVQAKMALKLYELFLTESKKQIVSALEIGRGTGILTQILASNLSPQTLYTNDIVDNFESIINNIVSKHSIAHTHMSGDIENIEINRSFDLIISNATLQWLTDFNRFITKTKKLLNSGGIFAFTTFGPNNFKEIKSIENYGLDYLDLNTIKEQLSKEFEILHISEENNTLYFPTPSEVMHHIKLTGVNSLRERKWSKSDYMNFTRKYKEQFSSKKGLSLTYHPYYIICKLK